MGGGLTCCIERTKEDKNQDNYFGISGGCEFKFKEGFNSP